MLFADLALSQRLELAEGNACLQFAAARKHAFPDCKAEWMHCGGGVAVFDGVESPTTQCFGLGIFEPLSIPTLEIVEQFFSQRGASVNLEVSPLVGVEAMNLLCTRNYRPVEVSSVLYRPVEAPPNPHRSSINARRIRSNEAPLWSSISTRAWAHEHPEWSDFILESAQIIAARESSPCFIAYDGDTPGAAGTLCIHEGVALFGGAATLFEMRRRGLQSALLDERMRYASEHGCDLAMMVAEAGSNSQRNAERKGFRIAYTRIKWRLVVEVSSPSVAL